MMNEIFKVMEFYHATEQDFSTTPKLISKERAKLRTKLMLEEAEEMLQASMNDDIVGVSDGIIDQLYILLGTALEYGLYRKLTAMFEEVHLSNMSKLDNNGKAIKREDGKVLKGPNYFKPDLKKFF